MKIDDLRAIAMQNGITGYQLATNKQIVWAIQKARGEECCFLSEQRTACQDLECEWRSECVRLIAEWRR